MPKVYRRAPVSPAWRAALGLERLTAVTSSCEKALSSCLAFTAFTELEKAQNALRPLADHLHDQFQPLMRLAAELGACTATMAAAHQVQFEGLAAVAREFSSIEKALASLVRDLPHWQYPRFDQAAGRDVYVNLLESVAEESTAAPRRVPRATQRAAVMAFVFIVAWLLITQWALDRAEEIDLLAGVSGLNPWVVACGCAWLTGKAFDELYPPEHEDDDFSSP